VVRAESAGDGQGATFVVHLPVRTARSNEPEPIRAKTGIPSPRMPQDSVRLRGVKILVVDDEADAREFVKRFLVECEAIPALAASAREAHHLIATFKPDLIVSDIGMPEQDGYEFMRDLRRHGISTAAVALTAFARAEDRIRSLQAGYQTHLPKPVEPAELVAVLANLAGRFEEAS
jgi:CheY-like chemotaxis protein